MTPDLKRAIKLAKRKLPHPSRDDQQERRVIQRVDDQDCFYILTYNRKCFVTHYKNSPSITEWFWELKEAHPQLITKTGNP